MAQKSLLTLFAIIIALGGLGYYFAKRYIATAVLSKNIEQDGFSGIYFAKSKTKDSPAVIILGANEWGEYWANQIADSGMIAFNLKYLNLPELQNKHFEIPLEYFNNGLKWLSEQPRVNPNKIVIMGASKHGAAALQVASQYPDLVHGVIAYAPTNVLWSAQTLPYINKDVSLWSLNNKPLPFLSMETIKPEQGIIDPLAYWSEGLIKADTIPEVIIKAEDITGPILLLSGKDDEVWPSAAMADKLAQRAKEKGFEFSIQNLQYENAGHLISAHPEMPADVRGGVMTIGKENFEFKFGGTAEGDKAAQKAAKEELFKYLKAL